MTVPHENSLIFKSKYLEVNRLEVWQLDTFSFLKITISSHNMLYE